MKKLFFILFFSTLHSLFALTIVLNSTKENKKDYAILHIFDKTPFACKKKIINIKKNSYICTINGSSDIKIMPKKTKFIDIYITKKSNSTIVTLIPVYNIKIFKISTPLYESKQIRKYIYKSAKHWIFLLYKGDSFLKVAPKGIGIKFPVYFGKSMVPSIGALDLNGIPIKYVSNSKDIQAYLSIKQDYKRKRYRFVISEADNALKDFPKSIFINDFLLYKIRSVEKVANSANIDPKIQDKYNNEIVKMGKSWIKKFPSNQNIPEVLYHIAKAYQNLGQNSDAKYFFDILITEHPKNKFTEFGILSFADSLYNEDQKEKALQLYKNVLYSTDNIKVASVAANKLAKLYLRMGNIKNAKKYYKKILDANPSFFLSDLTKAYNMAIKFQVNNMKQLSVKLLKKILSKINHNPGLKGKVLKALGDEYAALKNYKLASMYYKRYLKSFMYGQYVDEVKRSLDGLFFNVSDQNSTKLLNYYNKLIKKYDNGNIYQKANILKIKLLVKEKNYKQALKSLKNFQYIQKNKKIVQKLTKKAVQNIAVYNLKKENCFNTVKLLNEYKIEINKKYDLKLVKCYLDTSNYNRAFTLAKKRLKNTKLAPSKKISWLKVMAKILYEQHKYSKLLSLSNDVLSLGQTYGVKGYKEILYYKFFALFELRKYDLALKTANKIEMIFKNRYKNEQVYQKLVNYAKTIDNNLMVAQYARKIISLQKRYKSYVLSPGIEFDYITALKKLNKYSTALKIANNLLMRIHKKTLKDRVLYEIGDIYMKLKDVKSAKKSFKKCTDLNTTSGWKNLCKESLKFL